LHRVEKGLELRPDDRLGLTIHQLSQDREMSLPHLAHQPQGVRERTGSRLLGHGHEQVRDSSHGTDHHDRPLIEARGDDLSDTLNRFLVFYRSTTEFHHDHMSTSGC
jgi:hypothetical protein